MAKMNAKNGLKYIIAPRSVAVVGASQDSSKLGHVVVKRIIEGGYRGALYPINPKAKEILGLQAYPSIHSP